MATSRRGDRPTIEPRSVAERSPEEVTRELALHEVEQTLLNIEQAIRRAQGAASRISLDSNERNLRLALDDAIERLEEVRRELFQTGYFGGYQQRLLLRHAQRRGDKERAPEVRHKVAGLLRQ